MSRQHTRLLGFGFDQVGGSIRLGSIRLVGSKETMSCMHSEVCPGPGSVLDRKAGRSEDADMT